MTLKEAFEAMSVAGAIVSPVCAVYVAFRDARWRKNGLFAQLNGRIDKAARTAESWHESSQALVLFAQVDKNSARLGAVESRLDHTATREDVARVEGSIATVEALLKDTSAGVDRIEGMLMKKALNA